MPLTDTAIKAFKPEAKTRKYADGGGLYLEISPAGGKWWRLKYRVDGKEKRISLGVYPEVGLKAARQRRDEARELLAQGIDPGAARQEAKAERIAETEHTFEKIAREWYGKREAGLVESTRQNTLRMLEKDVLPWIGAARIGTIEAPDLLAIVKRIEGRGANELARRCMWMMGRVFRYGVAHGFCKRDPSRDIELGDVLETHVTRNLASQKDPKAVGELLRAIDGYAGHFVTLCALRIAPLVFVRPGELRRMEWAEIDVEKAEWRIPAGKMKMREQHLVPLARQALALLDEIRPLTGKGKYVFPSVRTSDRPMSENTINAALRRLGYASDEQTGHGFRSTASTLLHELGFPHEAIERQLAHAERNKVVAAYNYAQHLPERRKMMQAWADYLDKLKKGAEVLQFKSA